MNSTTAESPVLLSSDMTGSGPLAVLIHGITENRHSFDPLRAALSEHYRVLAVDLRGHGESPAADTYALHAMADDVAAVIARVSAESADPDGATSRNAAPPLVIGHSLGGIVAASYAARYPVRGVVNIDQSLQLGLMQGQVQSIEDMLRSDAYAAVIAAMFEQMAGALPPSEKDRIGAIRRPDQAVVLGIWSPLLNESAADLAALVDELVQPATSYPYLQIDGFPNSDDYLAWLDQRIPGGVVEDWGLLGHYPHLCEQERFVRRVLEFDSVA